MRSTVKGLVLHAPDGVRYVFDPGALCLEFLCTGGPGELARHEVLHQPRDLAVWFGLCRLDLDPDAVTVTGEELAAGRATRDALIRVMRAAAHVERGAPEDLAEIHRAAAAPPLVPYITPEGTRGWAPPVTGTQALSTIARDAVELLTGPHAGRIRECGADDCLLLFVDTSRPGRRRWCAMERCGNRHKVRALRARRGEGDPRPALPGESTPEESTQKEGTTS